MAIPAIAILGDLLESANESTRWVILAVLDDYLHSFGADQIRAAELIPFGVVIGNRACGSGCQDGKSIPATAAGG